MSVSEPSRSYSSFMFEGKERLRADGINEYDQGARRYAAAFPFFTTPDRKASSTPWLSPYSFCASNPINAVDPSGNLTIFINGFHCGDGGKSQYWEGVDKMVMKATNDPKALYIDGSIGGVFNLIPSLAFSSMPLGRIGLHAVNLNPFVRKNCGKKYAESTANDLLEILDDDEDIRIITHSMGGAFAKGYINGLLEVLGEDFSDRIKYELDLAPFDSLIQMSVLKNKTFTIQHIDDLIAIPFRMWGGTRFTLRWDGGNGIGGHGVKSYKEETRRFVEEYN